MAEKKKSTRITISPIVYTHPIMEWNRSDRRKIMAEIQKNPNAVTCPKCKKTTIFLFEKDDRVTKKDEPIVFCVYCHNKMTKKYFETLMKKPKKED